MSGIDLRHEPVMGPGRSPSVFNYLEPKSGESALDMTLGLGGHSKELLRLVEDTGSLTALDTDEENLKAATVRLGSRPNSTLMHANFRDAGRLGLPPFDVILADLGLSSPHIDDPARGFSFRHDGPLDLRFDRSRGETAAAFLERADVGDIARVLREYGELREAGQIARAIDAQKRAMKRGGEGHVPQTTAELRGLVEKTVGWRAPSVLPQVFQALRMQVNDELGALTELLDAIPALMKPGGRFGIISYHSLEDRLVKTRFREWSTAEKDPLTGQDSTPAAFELLTKKPVEPSPEEIAENPRARSAKFRAILRR